MQPYEPLPALARAIAGCQQVRPTPTPAQTTAQNVVFLLCLWLERAWALCHVGIGNVLISAFSTLAAVALWHLAYRHRLLDIGLQALGTWALLFVLEDLFAAPGWSPDGSSLTAAQLRRELEQAQRTQETREKNPRARA